MEYADILQTTAEIGVTIAGFASLATLFMTQPGTVAELETYRFEGMLINSLLVIAFALLPILIDALGVDAMLNWRISSFILLMVYSTRGIIITVRTLRFKKKGHPVGWPFIMMTALLFVVTLVLTLNSVLNMGDLAGGFYLVGLFGVLANACVLFLLVLLSVLNKAREQG